MAGYITTGKLDCFALNSARNDGNRYTSSRGAKAPWRSSIHIQHYWIASHSLAMTVWGLRHREARSAAAIQRGLVFMDAETSSA
jgi:hypothetical protein